MGGMNYDTRQTRERMNSSEGQECNHAKVAKYDTLHPRVLPEEIFWIPQEGKRVGLGGCFLVLGQPEA